MMPVTQVRLPRKLLKHMDKLVDKGLYATRSDVIRDAIRKQFLYDLQKQIGSIPNTGDSVEEVREIRRKLSKEPFDVEEINKLLR